VKSITVNNWEEILKGYTGHIKYTNGTQYWLKNGRNHREDGPAVIVCNGTKYWYKNGLCHREDGPAVITPDGAQYWYLDDIFYPRDDYYKELCKRGIITKQELFVELL